LGNRADESYTDTITDTVTGFGNGVSTFIVTAGVQATCLISAI
jgi:hypothetical protein